MGWVTPTGESLWPNSDGRVWGWDGKVGGPCAPKEKPTALQLRFGGDQCTWPETVTEGNVGRKKDELKIKWNWGSTLKSQETRALCLLQWQMPVSLAFQRLRHRVRDQCALQSETLSQKQDNRKRQNDKKIKQNHRFKTLNSLLPFIKHHAVSSDVKDVYGKFHLSGPNFTPMWPSGGWEPCSPQELRSLKPVKS